jgi:predicted nuclease of predicted toxin-antitoxin system
VIIWVDAQLPPALAGWLGTQFAVEAINLGSLGLRQVQDIDIFQSARRPGHVIMTKDDDFVDIVTRLGPPPQILWVTCGNVTNRALQELLTQAFPAARSHLEAGEPVVELTSR